MIFYLDTSALLKRYLQEVGSGWLAMLVLPTAGNTFATALITKAEAAAGLAAKVRQGGLPHQFIMLSDVGRALREEERLAWQRIIRVLGHGGQKEIST